jgi:hypothetical protein
MARVSFSRREKDYGEVGGRLRDFQGENLEGLVFDMKPFDVGTFDAPDASYSVLR